MKSIKEEGIWSIVSEINKKADIVVSFVKAYPPTTQTASDTVNPPITKEELGKIVNCCVQELENRVGQKCNQEIEKLNMISNGIAELKKILEQQPPKENISLENIAGLFPQPKKIAFFGFEFLRSSVVIFVSALFLFWSLVMNIKQADKYQIIKYRYAEQTELIRQMKTTIEKEKDMKEKDSRKKKK